MLFSILQRYDSIHQNKIVFTINIKNTSSYTIMSILSKLFHYVLLTTAKYGIDESHGITHSMNVFQYATKLYETEIPKYPILKTQKNLIYTSAILHDMCDKKYMDEKQGVAEIEQFLHNEHILCPNEIGIAKQIMTTMSYSKVKVHGFPHLGGYQRAYHIVREADLLTAYDFDRALIYYMNTQQVNIEDAFQNTRDLFHKRMLQHNNDHLFLLDYSKQESVKLHHKAIQRIQVWKQRIYQT